MKQVKKEKGTSVALGRIDYEAQFHAFLLTEKRVSQNTFQAYRRDIEQFFNFLKSKKIVLNRCRKNQLIAFLKYLKDEEISAKSVSRKISTLKLFFAFLHERFGFYNAAQTLIFPKFEQKLPSFLTELEVQNLLATANKERGEKGARNKVMLYLLYASGMRVSELVTLMIHQIEFESHFIRLSGKGNKERIVPLPQNIMQLLRQYIDYVRPTLIPAHIQEKAKLKNFLFPACYNNDLKPISRQSFWMILKKILLKANIVKPVSPHSLRHSLATHLLKKGADMRSLQLLLGHENLSTVQIYTHLGDSEMRKIYDKKHPRA